MVIPKGKSAKDGLVLESLTFGKYKGTSAVLWHSAADCCNFFY